MQSRRADAGGNPAVVAVTTYLDSIITLSRQNSIHRLTIDWTAYRAAVMAAAGSAQTVAEASPAIRVAIEQLRDGHSFYQPVSGPSIFVPTQEPLWRFDPSG